MFIRPDEFVVEHQMTQQSLHESSIRRLSPIVRLGKQILFYKVTTGIS